MVRNEPVTDVCVKKCKKFCIIIESIILNTSLLRMKNPSRQEIQTPADTTHRSDKGENWVFEATRNNRQNDSFYIPETDFWDRTGNEDPSIYRAKFDLDVVNRNNISSDEGKSALNEPLVIPDFKPPQRESTSNESNSIDKKPAKTKLKQQSEFMIPDLPLPKKPLPPGKAYYNKPKPVGKQDFYKPRIYGLPMFAAAEDCETNNNEGKTCLKHTKVSKTKDTSGRDPIEDIGNGNELMDVVNSSKFKQKYHKTKYISENELDISSIHGEGEQVLMIDDEQLEKINSIKKTHKKVSFFYKTWVSFYEIEN